METNEELTMFTTFSAVPENKLPLDQSHRSPDLASSKAKPKRHQVARACSWCRTYRIRCDAGYPCKNCQAKGRKCIDEKGKADVRTFPHAIKELDRLKERVKELEAQLKSYTYETQENRPDAHDVPVQRTVSLPTNLDPLREHGGNKKYYNWDFISTRTARSNQQCYGPSSSFYFIGQMTSYLDMTLQQNYPRIQLSSACRYFSSPVSTGRHDFVQDIVHSEGSLEAHNWSRSQEEYFLNLYWQSYHCIYPVLVEAEFKAHYKSLWETSEAYRRPSALVDIMLAICVQYGAVLVPPYPAMPGEGSTISDAAIAGRWFYRRCQSLLTDELEGPSIRTFQCHLLSVVWLSNASFQNMAHSVLAMGIRTGVILGLHLEPCEGISTSHREFRKRLWWTLYALEMKMGMELGRPLAVSISQVTCSIPAERLNPLEEKEKSPSETCFNAHFVKLLLATRAIYITFYHQCADVLGSNGQKGLYDDPKGLESCAEFLLSRCAYLQIWLQQVPDALKPQRRNAGEPFSTDRSALQVPLSTRSPMWLHRQSLILELLYHNLSMSLYRPFICFSRPSNPSTPLTEGHAISCVNHAITITNITHQMLIETELLSGWHETFQWQWNATLSLVGYILAYPIGPATPPARKALSTAITIFELLSSTFASAISAANVARDLSAKADLLVERFKASITTENPALALPPPTTFKHLPVPSFSGFTTLPESGYADMGDHYANYGFLSRLADDQSGLLFQNSLTSTSGFAFSFDDSLSGSSLGDVSAGADADVYEFLEFGDLGDGGAV